MLKRVEVASMIVRFLPPYTRPELPRIVTEIIGQKVPPLQVDPGEEDGMLIYILYKPETLTYLFHIEETLGCCSDIIFTMEINKVQLQQLISRTLVLGLEWTDVYKLSVH